MDFKKVGSCESRIFALIFMDSYLRNECADEDAFEPWLTYGVPDGALNDFENDGDMYQYENIAVDNESYNQICDLFESIVKEMNE